MQPQQKKGLIAVIALLLVAAGAGLILYGGLHAGVKASGPSKLARGPDGTLWVVSHQQLHQLTQDGQRLQKIKLSDFGVDDVVSGIAVAKNNVIFIAQATPSGILRCSAIDKKCADITPAIAKSAGPTSYAVMLAADDATGRLLISDNAGHRILITDFDGNVLDRTVRNVFIYPNQPSWLSADEIVIPDTDHFRVARFAVKDNKLGEQLSQFSTAGLAVTRFGRTGPMDVVRDGQGLWWALIAMPGMVNADLVRFDGGGTPLARIDLGKDTDPTAIALAGEALIVAEPLRARLTKVSSAASGYRTEAFGDAAFEADLEVLRKERILWARLRMLGQMMCVLGPLIAIFLLWRLEQKTKNETEGGAA
jgi:hypothetical protein